MIVTSSWGQTVCFKSTAQILNARWSAPVVSTNWTSIKSRTKKLIFCQAIRSSSLRIKFWSRWLLWLSYIPRNFNFCQREKRRKFHWRKRRWRGMGRQEKELSCLQMSVRPLQGLWTSSWVLGGNTAGVLRIKLLRRSTCYRDISEVQIKRKTLPDHCWLRKQRPRIRK